MKKAILLLYFLLPHLLYAHSGEEHPQKKDALQSEQLNPSEKATGSSDVIEGNTQKKIEQIRSWYQQKIEPIFKAKCFDCHGEMQSNPWYVNLPGVKQLIERDIHEAKKHLDMSKGFPFISHSTMKRNFKAFIEVMEEEEMPPFLYVMMHKESTINPDERKKIIQWSVDSLNLLK
ncbi:MAG: heme-binding domain-containing protein [Proteobacteria bacterium]|nr:heme-binding domain-containing protein [Pseudomonadota bacterium]